MILVDFMSIINNPKWELFMKDKVTLYIATHNKTGMKYFGKTIRYFTVKDLQENYHGGGKHWNNYLVKHGDDVTMEIYGIFSLNEDDPDYVKPIALKFSKENNIVEDYYKWANQVPENGLGGGGLTVEQLTPEQRKRISDSKKGTKNPMYGKKLSKEQREKIGNSNRGKKRSEEFSEKMRNRRGEKRSSEACENIGASKRGEKHPFYGKNHTEEHCNNISKARSGQKLGPMSDKHKENISEGLKKQSKESIERRTKALRGKKRELKKCPHCGKIGGGGAIKQWHFDKCKQKDKNE